MCCTWTQCHRKRQASAVEVGRPVRRRVLVQTAGRRRSLLVLLLVLLLVQLLSFDTLTSQYQGNQSCR